MDTVYVIKELDSIEVWQFILSIGTFLVLIANLFLFYRQFSDQQSEINSLKSLAEVTQKRFDIERLSQMPYFKNGGGKSSGILVEPQFINKGKTGLNLKVNCIENSRISTFNPSTLNLPRFENGHTFGITIRRESYDIDSILKLELQFQDMSGDNYKQIITISNNKWTISEPPIEFTP